METSVAERILQKHYVNQYCNSSYQNCAAGCLFPSVMQPCRVKFFYDKANLEVFIPILLQNKSIKNLNFLSRRHQHNQVSPGYTIYC